MRISRAAVCVPFAMLFAISFTGCSEGPKTEVKKEAEKPAEPMTGRQAFQQMYPGARAWARDAEPLQLESYNLTKVKSGGGKAGAWQATFVSPTLRKSRMWTWSAAEAEGNLHKGVFAGLEQYWAGPTGQAMPFEIVAIRTDSDAALAAAMEQKDTVTFTKKFPDKPIMFILEKTRRFPDLAWRVLWGESVSTSEYTVFVDASTGKFLQKVR